MPWFVCIGDLLVRPWFAIVENVAVDVLLGTSFIDLWIRGVFSTKRKVNSWHSTSVGIISTKSEEILNFADINPSNSSTSSPSDAGQDYNHFLRLASNFKTVSYARDSAGLSSRRLNHDK